MSTAPTPATSAASAVVSAAVSSGGGSPFNQSITWRHIQTLSKAEEKSNQSTTQHFKHSQRTTFDVFTPSTWTSQPPSAEPPHPVRPAQPDALQRIHTQYQEMADPKPKPTKRGQPKEPLKSLLFYKGSEQQADGSKLAATAQLSQRGHGLYSAVEEAWATHGGLVLSPDDIWMAVQLQFCKYMDANAEALRDIFVSHQGQKELEVELLRVDYPLFMELLMGKIQENVKNNVHTDFLPHFSTSTPLQSQLKQLAVMDCMQQYFTYKMRCMCGIERVGFVGTLDDWQLLRDTVAGLAKFHLDTDSKYFSSLRQWVGDVVVIVDKLIDTYRGEADVRWWNGVLQREQTYGSGGTAYIDGWLLTFLTSNYKQRMEVEDVPAMRFSVPVLIDDNGHVYRVRVMGGFSGVLRDADTNTYTPQHSVAVVFVGEGAGDAKADSNGG